MASIPTPVNIGLIGCGKVSSNHHLPVLKATKGANVVALADIDPATREKVSESFQIDKRYDDYRHLLDDSEIDLVAVCVPLRFHYEIALAALNAGKHLMLEKPVTLSLDEADSLVRAASASNRKLLVGFNDRWHRLVRQARRIINSGQLGRVISINSTHSSGHYGGNTPEWRRSRDQGGGCLIEKGSHVYDLWHFFLRCKIKEVWATSRSVAGFDDRAGIVTARTEEGVSLNCVLSDYPPDHHEMVILGDKRVLKLSFRRFDGLELGPTEGHAGDIMTRLKHFRHSMGNLPAGLRSLLCGGVFQESFQNQWRHFIDCVLEDKPVGCTVSDGRRSLAVALAAVSSASTNETVGL